MYTTLKNYAAFTSSGRPAGSTAAPLMPPGGVGPGLPVADGVNGLSQAKHAFVCSNQPKQEVPAQGTRTTRTYVYIVWGGERKGAMILCLSLRIIIMITMFAILNNV